MEEVQIDVPDEFTGAVIQKLSMRKGELMGMSPAPGNLTRLVFSIPSRGLIGYRGEFLTDTKGNGIMNQTFVGYEPFKGPINYRAKSSLIAFETGEASAYGIFNAQDRGISSTSSRSKPMYEVSYLPNSCSTVRKESLIRFFSSFFCFFNRSS